MRPTVFPVAVGLSKAVLRASPWYHRPPVSLRQELHRNGVQCRLLRHPQRQAPMPAVHLHLLKRPRPRLPSRLIRPHPRRKTRKILGRYVSPLSFIVFLSPLFFGTLWFFFFFIEHFLSAQQRNRPLLLRTPTRRLLHRRKRSIRPRRHLRHRSLLSTPTRLTRMGPMQQLALRNNRHPHQRLRLWCRSNSRNHLNRHSSSNRRRQTRTSRLVISILLRMYVSSYISAKRRLSH